MVKKPPRIAPRRLLLVCVDTLAFLNICADDTSAAAVLHPAEMTVEAILLAPAEHVADADISIHEISVAVYVDDDVDRRGIVEPAAEGQFNLFHVGRIVWFSWCKVTVVSPCAKVNNLLFYLIILVGLRPSVELPLRIMFDTAIPSLLYTPKTCIWRSSLPSMGM